MRSRIIAFSRFLARGAVADVDPTDTGIVICFRLAQRTQADFSSAFFLDVRFVLSAEDAQTSASSAICLLVVAFEQTIDTEFRQGYEKVELVLKHVDFS